MPSLRYKINYELRPKNNKWAVVQNLKYSTPFSREWVFSYREEAKAFFDLIQKANEFTDIPARSNRSMCDCGDCNVIFSTSPNTFK